MDIIQAEEILEKYTPFSLRALTEVVSILKFAEKNNYDIEEFKEAIKVFKENRKKTESPIDIRKPCPECGKLMQPVPDDEEGFQFICANCRYGQYIDIPLHKYVKMKLEEQSLSEKNT